MSIDDWPAAPWLHGEQLDLEPLRAEHAAEMTPVLDDLRLHTFIGGQPATEEELRRRYERQAVGHSVDGSQRWLNWIVRRRLDEQSVGTVQATVSEQGGRSIAELAWVIGTAHQGQGYAQEATRVMVAWLRQHGVEVLVANVHPHHQASMAVARAVGLEPTSTVTDGEARWQNQAARARPSQLRIEP